MTLTVHHCPFCPVHALVYDGNTTLMQGHLTNVHNYPQ